MPVIAARLLGPIELELAGGPAPRSLRWRKHLALCLLLWHASERRLARDRALGLLWGDRDERDARHSLNEALRVIRRALGDGAIETAQDWIIWRGDVSLDTDRFTTLERVDAPAAADLIVGDWCEGFSVPGAPDCDRWLEDERRWWRTRLVATLIRGAALAEGDGNLARTLMLAARARRLDPLGEAAARSMVRAQYLAGDRAGALATGHEFVRQLAAELGALPDAATRDLLKGIASAGPRSVHETGDIPGPVPGLLVGRESAMQAITRALGQSFRVPHSGMLLVVGEPGSGRTRLAEESVTRATADGASVLFLRAIASDGGTGQAGLRALAGVALRRAPGLAAVAPAVVGTLVAEVPDWAERFVASPGDGPMVSLAAAVAAVLRTAAVERPVLVAIDDADLLDDETLLALPELLRATSELGVMFLVTASSANRRAALDQLSEHLDRDSRGVVVLLSPLEEGDLGIAVSAAMPHWDDDARLRLTRRLHAESAGLPGLAFPVLTAVMAGLDFDDDPWPARDRTYDATLPGDLPGSLLGAVRLRFHLLPPAARQVLLAVSLAPGALTDRRIATITGVPDRELDAILDHLEASRWLVSDDRGYQFRARAIRSLVTTKLVTPGMRRRLSREVDDSAGA